MIGHFGSFFFIKFRFEVPHCELFGECTSNCDSYRTSMIPASHEAQI